MTISQIAVADIGGTHARFAIATIGTGQTPHLDHCQKLKVAEYATPIDAWEHYRRECDVALPNTLALAVAAPVDQPELQLTNSPWILSPNRICEDLGLGNALILNDFGAACHLVAKLDGKDTKHVCGPDTGLPQNGVISVIGPGTGLGVAFLERSNHEYRVFETEGGHANFSPQDEFEDRLLNNLRERHGRVSLDRVITGKGLIPIYQLACELHGELPKTIDEFDLWALALEGLDKPSSPAMERFLCVSARQPGTLFFLMEQKQP